MCQADGMFPSEKHSGWSFAEKAFVKQSLKCGVQNFAQNWQLYPESALPRVYFTQEGKADSGYSVVHWSRVHFASMHWGGGVKHTG